MNKWRMTMRKTILFIFLCVFGFTGCASNPIVSGSNGGGLVGASGGAYGGSVLCKNCSGGAKIASIGGGALLGWLLGSKVGEFWDEKMKARQVRLIEETLEKNQDNQTSTDTFTKSWKNPNTGRTEQHTVQQSVTPTRTYRQPIQPMQQGSSLPNGHPQKWEDYYYTQRNQQNQLMNTKYCREWTIDIRVDKELTGSLEDTKTQYFNSCRSQSGWRTLQ
jgi:hypothetical protein